MFGLFISFSKYYYLKVSSDQFCNDWPKPSKLSTKFMLELLFLSLFKFIFSSIISFCYFIFKKCGINLCFCLKDHPNSWLTRRDLFFMSFTEDLILKMISLFPLIIFLVTLFQVVKNSIFC
jgi:hypothetical protein